jgi:hypothetical protein
MTSRRAAQKRLIEQAYEQAEAAGIVQVNEDEAGPCQAIAQPGAGVRNQKGIPCCSPMSTSAGGPPKS